MGNLSWANLQRDGYAWQQAWSCSCCWEKIALLSMSSQESIQEEADFPTHVVKKKKKKKVDRLSKRRPANPREEMTIYTVRSVHILLRR